MMLDFGDEARAGELVASASTVELHASLTDVLSGLTYNGVSAEERYRVIKVEPRDDADLLMDWGEGHLVGRLVVSRKRS